MGLGVENLFPPQEGGGLVGVSTQPRLRDTGDGGSIIGRTGFRV